MNKLGTVVFLTSAYYPQAGATAHCQETIANEFSRRGWSVVIISIDGSVSSNSKVKVENQIVFRITTKDLILRRKVGSIKNQFLKMFLSFILKVYHLLFYWFSLDMIFNDRIKAYKNAMIENDIIPDILISVCEPFESVVYASQYKKTNPKTKIFTMLYDTFSENHELHKLAVYKNIRKKVCARIEEHVIRKYDAVFYVQGWGG